ncbi:hypothetical protein LCGC14_0797170 [marine sediment metagenome]|uniref:Uncharacterized protein n=1 Tax=marine sediment metagenome TaxID=412755 RepID=A0A0F9SXX0_9ZZZZ
MSIFGNGVISGWTVEQEETFGISISEGSANVNFMATSTTFPESIQDIPPGTVNYVYARALARTAYAGDVDFFLSPSPNLADPSVLLLAEVVTDSLSVSSIDNSVRQQIGFIELIQAAIQMHKHRGGSFYPSKVDLSSEVKGQLPSFRIADFDAEKVTTGTFDLARMPLLDHQELQNIGLLTHPQLDSFVKTLEVSNKELFGEIGTSNLLQLVLALKFIYDDPESVNYLENSLVDENFINEFTVIPGITPDSSIDFDNTTAVVDLDQHFIAGVPPVTGTSFYINWDTALAWNSSFSMENLVVVGNTVTLAFNEDEETNIVTIEGFESATAPGQDLSGGSGGQTLFTKQTLILTDNAQIVADSGATNVIEGFYSGKFKSQQSFRLQYAKEFNELQDWSTYDSLVLHIKCIDAIHGPVSLYLEGETVDDRSIDFVILDQNEITENSESNDFEIRTIDLSTIPFRDKIKKLVIYTDDLDNPFDFLVDFINIQRAVLLPDEGTLKLRYSSGTRVTFATVEWNAVEPSGTEITVRSKAADGTVFLNRADYTPLLSNGQTINLDGTDLELEIKFFPDSAKVSAPILNSVRVLVITQAELDGFAIDTQSEFARGIAKNITVDSTPSVELDTPIYVDSYVFALANSVAQIHENTSGSVPFTETEISLSGLGSPISPNTVFRTIENGVLSINTPSFFEPRSVIRKEGRRFVVADTYNDRVLEYDEDETLVAGFGSISYEHGSKLFPIAASVDTRTSILYLVWSRKISFKTVNINKIVMQDTTQTVQLIKDFDKILGLTTAELNEVDAEGQIMPVHLSIQNAALVQSLDSDGSYILVSTDAITTGLDIDSVFYEAISTALGIPLFIGPFAYIDGVFSPTWADRTDNDTYMVANAKVAVKEWEFPEGVFAGRDTEVIERNTNASNIIEVDENNQIIFGSDVVEFSPFVPGRAERIDDNTLLIAGLKPGGQIGELQEDRKFDFRTIGGDSETTRNQKLVLNDLFFNSSNPFVGAVLVFDTRSRATSFEYLTAEGVLASDVDIDPRTGLYVVAESSFNRSGRIIKLDATGNIVFSFGEGIYSIISSLRTTVTGSMIIST